MVLYKISFAIFPVKDIYARSRDDIERWLESYHRNPFEVVTKDGKDPGSIADLVQIEKGEVMFDFGGIAAGNKFPMLMFFLTSWLRSDWSQYLFSSCINHN